MPIDPVPLQHREYGTGGPAIVLLHGLFGSSANWGSIARELSGGYRVIVPDLRNHGQSPHAERMDYPAMAADLWRLLEHLEITRPILAGHSMGGKVVMRAALERPGHTRGIAVVDIAPVSYAHDFSLILEGLRAIDLDGLANRSQADRILAAFVPEPEVRAFLLQNLVRGPAGWRWRLNLPALASSMRSITGFEAPPGAVYPGPAHFIHGARSHYVLPEYGPRMRELFADAVLCRVEEAGHWVYAEQRAGFMACLQRFLQAATG